MHVVIIIILIYKQHNVHLINFLPKLLSFLLKVKTYLVNLAMFVSFSSHQISTSSVYMMFN
jgi:hypothetical protein